MSQNVRQRADVEVLAGVDGFDPRHYTSPKPSPYTDALKDTSRA